MKRPYDGHAGHRTLRRVASWWPAALIVAGLLTWVVAR